MKELPKAYNHSDVEENIYKMWEESGFFNPDNLTGEPYTIIMPPPNANAPMHLGHALFVTIEDILIRYNRMQGKKTLWQPGTDHAGFETQVVFEKKLDKEGTSRFNLGREEFYKKCWDFVQSNKHITEESLRRLGASCDWSRNIFTLDPEIVKIVYSTFKQMYEDGLVYRSGRICNWCPKHQTGLADLETKYEERIEPFYYFKYGPFTIGTSRPETKFGDKYVVMHPADKRYEQYKQGDTFTAEWINGPVKATVIKDEAVDMEFGSGVMTITPAHDPVDFEIAQRHKLDIETVIDKRGKLLDIAGEFKGLKILEARPKIVEKLQSKGLLEKVDDNYKHNVQMCYKCGNLIEPQIVDQWYIAMTKQLPDGRPSLRDMTLKALDNKEVEIVTEKFEKIFRHWMENIRDWPISRQIWWGIPIPVWYKTEVGSTMETVHFEPETLFKKLGLKTEAEFNSFSNKFFVEQKEKIGWGTITGKDMQLYIGYINLLKERGYIDDDWINKNKVKRSQKPAEMFIGEKPPQEIGWYQDPDTFDTWFSSGQWPFATLMANDAKKEQSANKQISGSDFKQFFPTEVMETGWDILFFWVARMVMLSYYKTGKPPFKKVFLHGLVRDKDRQKMSKSKGNVIDPLGVIDTYGTDALRFALIFSTAAGNDIPLAEDKIKGMKHFANKLWNISRYVIAASDKLQVTSDKLKPETDADKDILKKLDALVTSATKNLETFQLHEAAQEIYQFVWHEFADIYIEESKKQLANEKLIESTLYTLHFTLLTCLRLLHPFMPFVTEHIWQLLKERGLVNPPASGLLMVEKWPKN